MTATSTPTRKTPDLRTLQRQLREAEELADAIGERLGWNVFTAESGETRADLEYLRAAAVREVESLRAEVARALAAEGSECRECGGHEYVPTAGLTAGPCPECAAVVLRLPPTRAEAKGRPVKYLPAVKRLTIGSGRKAVTYTLAEFTPDREGRAWTPPGACYEAAPKGNGRAYWAGGDVYGTDCCKHVSAVRALLRAGLLDSTPATGVESESDPFA